MLYMRTKSRGARLVLAGVIGATAWITTPPALAIEPPADVAEDLRHAPGFGELPRQPREGHVARDAHGDRQAHLLPDLVAQSFADVEGGAEQA